MENKVEIQARFGKALIQLMKQKGLSLRKLALASELEYAQVQRISKGKVNLELSSVIALCNGLKIEPEEFFSVYAQIKEI